LCLDFFSVLVVPLSFSITEFPHGDLHTHTHTYAHTRTHAHFSLHLQLEDYNLYTHGTHPCHSSQQQNLSRRGQSDRPVQQGLTSKMFSLAAQRHKRSLLQCKGNVNAPKCKCFNGSETEGPHTIPGVEDFMVCLNKNMKITLCPNSTVS